MPTQSDLQRFYHLRSNPFSSRVKIDAPIVGRQTERQVWQNILDTKAGERGNSLNFIIGDYGMGKTHALFHIKRDSDQRGLVSVIIKLLPEDEVKNFGMDFVRRIFKHLDQGVKNKLSKLKKPSAFNHFPDHVEIIKKYASGDNIGMRILTSAEKITKRELNVSGLKITLVNTETALEFLCILLSMLQDIGYKSLVLCVDEAEYIFSQMTSRKAALVFNSLRAMYDLPETPDLGLLLQPLANILFFFAISTAGMEKLSNMEKVEMHQGGPIQPLLTRVDKRINLTFLSDGETRDLIEEYLKTSRTTGQKLPNPLIPYRQDFVDYVYKLTLGHPRSIVERCDYVITEGLKDHVKLLTRDYAKQVFTRLNLPTA